MKKKKMDSLRLGVGKRFPISPSLFVAGESLVLTFVLEILSRRSFMEAGAFLIHKPILFGYNWALVALTLAVGMMFRKKVFSLSLITMLWLGFGIADCLVLSWRSESPLTAKDLLRGMEGITMMPAYLKIWQIVLIGAGAVAVVAGLVVLAVRSPRYRWDWQRSLLRLTCFAVVFLGYTVLLFAQDGMISRSLRPSLYKSYKDYGFPYCFAYSFIDGGIRKPDAYSPSEVMSISSDLGIDVSAVEKEEDTNVSFIDDFIESVRLGLFESKPEEYTVEAVEAIRSLLKREQMEQTISKPNVIFVQLESFFDPLWMKDLEFSGDPIPNFRALSENFSSGILSVPTVSGGTANTEFEVLTGCSLDFFGAGELPYYTVMRKMACETLATDLRAIGYTATAIHNYTGWFYNRNLVYENMGFHRFISQEYMNGFSLNPKGWPRDEILPREIARAVQASEGPDFVFTVTMQTHGAYIELPEEMDSPVSATGDLPENELATVNYYLSQLVETDRMIGELIAALEALDEDTVIVFYGDHLPSLNLTESELVGGDIYVAPYVIWDNMGLNKVDRDIEAYQLGAWTLKQIGNDLGVMVRFHQTKMDDEDYQKSLEILEYDMLYGDRVIYGGNLHAYENHIEMGLDPIEITDVYTQYGNLFVAGENFTYASRVMLDEEEKDTIFVSPQLLIVVNSVPEDGARLSVAQVADEGVELSRTESVECRGLMPVIYSY